MRKAFILFIVLIAAWSVPKAALSTHVVGAEIYYTHLGNFNYRIFLTVYRDCGPTNENGTGFDPDAVVTVYDSNNQVSTNLLLNLTSALVENVPITLDNPCFILPDDVCIQGATYTATVFLPWNTGGYTLTYQRCCFNSSVSNILNPEDTGLSATVTVPGSALVSTPNSSAIFTKPSPAALCLGAEFFYDNSATDADGDVLVYSFCDPLTGGDENDPAPNPAYPPPYPPVQWQSGHSASYPIPSSPAFQIDPNSGFMTGTANQLGLNLIGICVSELRNGVVISSHIRVFQYRVTMCDPNIVAGVSEQEDECSGLEVEFNNSSINGTFFHWDFGVPGTTSDFSTDLEPTFVYPEAGTYTVMLVANPGWPCADTTYSELEIFPSISPKILDPDFNCVNDKGLYNFSMTANISPNALIEWDFGAGSIPQFSQLPAPQQIHLNPEASQHIIQLRIIDHGCTEVAYDTLENPAEPIASIEPQSSFCNGLSYTFKSASVNSFEYQWDFGTNSPGDESSDQDPEFTFPDEGVYEIVLIASAPFTCPDTTEMTFEIYELLAPSFDVPEPQCFSEHAFSFNAEGAASPNPFYSWNFGPLANPSSSSDKSPQGVVFAEFGKYPVTLTISENGCTFSFTREVWVVQDPNVEVTFGKPEGCPDLYSHFIAVPHADTQMYFEWTFGDGEESTEMSPTHVYTQSGYYDVTLKAYTTTACIKTLEFEYPDVIHVYDVPVPGFLVDPAETDILNPQVEIVSTSETATSCQYFMSDGGSSTDCELSYTWSQSGRMNITQFVYNEEGCVASTTGFVNILGYLFYAPNAFTPDGDGINDYWKPEHQGIQNYHIYIFDRWGTTLFESHDPDEVWLGNVRNGDHYANNGMYTYLIQFTDMTGTPAEYSGTILLTR